MEGRPPERQPLVQRRTVRRQRIFAGELHAGQACAGFGRHQVAVSGQACPAEDTLVKGTAACRQHQGAGVDTPVMTGLPGNAGGADDGIAIRKQFQRRMMVEHGNAGHQHAPAHEAHVVGPAQIGDVEPPVILAGERISPFRKPEQVLVGRVHAAQHPALIGEFAGALPAPLDNGVPVVARWHAPRSGVGRRGGAAGAKIALVGQHNLRAAFGRRDGRPGRRWTAAEHQHIGMDP